MIESEVVEQQGPWPFITRRVMRSHDGREDVWSSRHHRKGLLPPEIAREEVRWVRSLRCLWMPGSLNWWIGCVFAVGATLFATASWLSLDVEQANRWSLGPIGVNAIFFAGSIPFTTAAYLQLFQAANAHPFPIHSRPQPTSRQLLGWRPWDIGWLSCFLQWVGTLLFNVSTFAAMTPGLGWIRQEEIVWLPNLAGSILFLLSGYLAFGETCHAHWGWRPRDLSWCVVFANLLGCVGFMIAAIAAFVLPSGQSLSTTTSLSFTLFGAIGFLSGSLLMLPESTATQDSV